MVLNLRFYRTFMVWFKKTLEDWAAGLGRIAKFIVRANAKASNDGHKAYENYKWAISGYVLVFWIAPYFLEGHIKKANASLQMSDYQVNYSNHASFCKGTEMSQLK